MSSNDSQTPSHLSLAVVFCQVVNASLAALTAASVSPALMSGTDPSTDPVIGLEIGKVDPDSAPTHFPLTDKHFELIFCVPWLRDSLTIRLVSEEGEGRHHPVSAHAIEDPSSIADDVDCHHNLYIELYAD